MAYPKGRCPTTTRRPTGTSRKHCVSHDVGSTCSRILCCTCHPHPHQGSASWPSTSCNHITENYWWQSNSDTSNNWNPSHLCEKTLSWHLQFNAPPSSETHRGSTIPAQKANLVGGFNPFEKYESNWIISPGRGENKKSLKPPPRNQCRWGQRSESQESMARSKGTCKATTVRCVLFGVVVVVAVAVAALFVFAVQLLKVLLLKMLLVMLVLVLVVARTCLHPPPCDSALCSEHVGTSLLVNTICFSVMQCSCDWFSIHLVQWSPAPSKCWYLHVLDKNSWEEI